MVPINTFNYKSERSNYSYTSKVLLQHLPTEQRKTTKNLSQINVDDSRVWVPFELEARWLHHYASYDWLIDDYQGDLWPWWWEHIVRVSKVTIPLNRSWEIVKFLYEWSPQAEKWFLLLQAAGLCKWNGTHLLPVYRQFIVTKTEPDFLTPVWSNGKQWAHFTGQLNHS
jgi:hypothetical protein